MNPVLFPSQPQCVQDAGSWCATFYRLTDNDVLARSADAIMTSTAHIAIIVIGAIVLRFLVHRLVDRIVHDATDGPVVRLARRAARPLPTSATRTARSVQRARTVGSVLRSIGSAVILTVAAIMVLAEFGVNLAPILASAGIVGVAVGFGAQNLVKDFLSGMFMLMEDQYGVGDIVDVGSATGVVEAVGLRITTVRDENGTVWFVRNGEILRVGNKSQGFAVAVVDLLVGYAADVGDATELAGRVARERVQREDLAGDVLDDVEVLGVERVANEGLTLRLTVRVNPGRQFAVQRALYAAITEAFEDAGVLRPGQTAHAPPVPPVPPVPAVPSGPAGG